MTDPKRRSSDRRPSADIEKMIMQEDDPKQRAFLIVLNSINNSLVANTETIRDVSDKLEAHLENFENHSRNEEAIMNKGRGAWKVAAWVIGVAQIAGVFVWTQAREEVKEINSSLKAEREVIVRLDTRITVLEAKK